MPALNLVTLAANASLAQSTITLGSPYAEITVLGTVLGGGALAWLLYKGMFSGWSDFEQSVNYLFTSGWTSTLRGDMKRNISGTFRFLLWLWLSMAGTIVSGLLIGALCAAIAG